MATPHIGCEKEDISELVLMPGDPLRAKYIADNFLEDVKLVNDVRNMFAYTGFYKGKRITVFPSGMGIPSMGIYAYELFKFYDVKKIIRIGTAGSFNKDIKIMDVVLSEGATARSYFTELLDNKVLEYVPASKDLNLSIINHANDMGITCNVGRTITTDVFDPYCDDKEAFASYFWGDKYLATEMEAFALFYLAERFKKDASCLITIVDSKYEERVVSSEDREKSLNDMITIALESI